MLSIRSPLGALGALMVLLQGIATAALVPLQSEPSLQRLIVWMMVASISMITLVVAGVVVWFALRNPGLLFNPRDISPEVHIPLYSPGSRGPTSPPSVPHQAATFEVSPGERDEPNQ